jgi:hypothetical protein
MECTNCGVDIPAGAEDCPGCGLPAGAAPATAAVPTDAKSPSRRSDGGSDSAAAPGHRPLFIGIAVAVVVVALGLAGFFVLRALGDTPEGAVSRMMSAYANYDGQGILDNATHASLTATDQASFRQQNAKLQAASKGLPAIKGLKITNTTHPNATTAVVQFSASWLTDPAKGTYTQRDEVLTVIKQNGTWVVRLFP